MTTQTLSRDEAYDRIASEMDNEQTWNEYCTRWDNGELCSADLRAAASSLFKGERLADALSDVDMVEGH